MIRCEEIWKGFDGQHVLRGVNASFNRGELIGLIGPSGGGKSVLLKIIGGVLEADYGEVKSNGAVGTGFLFQEGALFDSMNVLDNVAFALREAHPDLNYQQLMSRSYESLCGVGLGKDYKKMPGQLSGGMRRRVALARAVVARPELVLLDDPTGGLDPVAASVIMKLISDLHRDHGSTIIIVSHDLRRLLPSVPRVIGLFGGKVTLDCPPDMLPQTASSAELKFIETRYDFGASAAAH
ncbi:MAG: ATP-binding cassette domain-containing protein [Bdellovibrionales bacterium]|nr:ATP-binding cassette domain-containing protein [Bdellovibrionales bacterium]